MSINGIVEFVGLFGKISNALIKNVNLENVNIVGDYRVAGLVGQAEGFLYNAWMIEGFGALIRSCLILIGLIICLKNDQ